MGKGKELEFPEGRGGCQGSEVACDLNLIARSAMGARGNRGFPLKCVNKFHNFFSQYLFPTPQKRKGTKYKLQYT
jgi:hypothetical protein